MCSLHASSDFLVVNFIVFIIPFTWFFTLHCYRVLNIEQLWNASRKQIGEVCYLKFRHCMLKWTAEKWLWRQKKRMINQAKVRCMTVSYDNTQVKILHVPSYCSVKTHFLFRFCSHSHIREIIHISYPRD